jgi:hypothetical protein
VLNVTLNNAVGLWIQYVQPRLARTTGSDERVESLILVEDCSWICLRVERAFYQRPIAARVLARGQTGSIGQHPIWALVF